MEKNLEKKIKLDWGDKPINNFINNSRLVVCTYIGTTYLETLPNNIPTIIYENFKNTSFRDEALDDLYQLKKVNILFEDPKEASEFINDNWSNLKKWWLSENTQKVIDNFCLKYAKKNVDITDDITNIIKNEITN